MFKKVYYYHQWTFLCEIVCLAVYFQSQFFAPGKKVTSDTDADYYRMKRISRKGFKDHPCVSVSMTKTIYLQKNIDNSHKFIEN